MFLVFFVFASAAIAHVEFSKPVGEVRASLTSNINTSFSLDLCYDDFSLSQVYSGSDGLSILDESGYDYKTKAYSLASYLLSNPGTIVVFTRIKIEGKAERQFVLVPMPDDAELIFGSDFDQDLLFEVDSTGIQPNNCSCEEESGFTPETDYCSCTVTTKFCSKCPCDCSTTPCQPCYLSSTAYDHAVDVCPYYGGFKDTTPLGDFSYGESI